MVAGNGRQVAFAHGGKATKKSTRQMRLRLCRFDALDEGVH